jgi:hypothetical protein
VNRGGNTSDERRLEALGKARLDAAVARLSRLPDGDGNRRGDQFYGSARWVGEAVGAGMLDRAQASDALRACAEQLGLAPSHQAWRGIEKGLDDGARDPMTIEQLDRETPRSNGRPPQPSGKRTDPLPTDADLEKWRGQLASSEAVLTALWEARGFSPEALQALGVGYRAGARKELVIPIRDKSGQLVNIVGWTPAPNGNGPKAKALAGRPRDLFPAPETIEGELVWILEGEPDSVSARSLGLPAVGLPGANAVKRVDPQRFVGRRVLILLDCDDAGRRGAQQLAERLAPHAESVRVVDLDPERSDGHDLGDYVREAVKGGPEGLEQARHRLDALAARAPLVEPPAPVEVAELLDEIMAFVRRFVVLPGKHEAVAVALFVLHSWALDGAHATPYLLVLSPEKRSGKTRLLEVLSQLVRHPWHTTSTSEAAMFRKIERDEPTLLLDEIDAIFGSNSDRTEPLRAILNSGNRRGATVTRCVGKEHEVADFPVFCPKVLAGIDSGKLPDTIRDRSIALPMKRRHDGEKVERFRERKASALAEPTRLAALRWARTAVDGLLAAEPSIPDDLGDRAADAWEPLVAIADLAGGDWPARARDAALMLSGAADGDDGTIGTVLLAATRRLLADREKVFTSDLLELVNGDEDLPFGGWKDGKGIDARKAAQMLRKYGCKPRTVRIDDQTAKGYHADDLRDAWMRYLPAEPRPDERSYGAEPSHTPKPSQETAREQGVVTDVSLVTAVTKVSETTPDTILGGVPRGHEFLPGCDEFDEQWEREHAGDEIASDEDEALLERARELLGGAE